MRMTERLRVIDKCMQDKINDCLENIREMKEIETQLQQSFGVDPHITKSCASDIDSWLVKWKITRERNIEFYTCISGLVGQHVPKVKVALRIAAVIIVRVEYGTEASPSGDANPSQLEALHEEHLQDEIDILETHLIKIRGEHRFLADQLRSKFV